MQISQMKRPKTSNLNLSSEKHFNTSENVPQVIRSPNVMKISYTNGSAEEPEIICKRLEKTAQCLMISLIGREEFNPVPISVLKPKKKVTPDEKYIIGTSPSSSLQANKQKSPIHQNHFQNFDGTSSSQKHLKQMLGIKTPPDKKEMLPFRNIEIKNKDMSSSTIFNLQRRNNSQPNLEDYAKKMSMTMLDDIPRKGSLANNQSSFQSPIRMASPGNISKGKKSQAQNLEKIINQNAKRALAEKKKQKKYEDYLRLRQLEKKQKLEEDNRKIRLQNMNQAQERSRSPKFAWGVDQRKFSHPGPRLSSSPENHYETNPQSRKISEKERRERLGLSHLNDNFISHIAKKKTDVQKASQKDEDQFQKMPANVSKKSINENDRQRIKEFMNQKQKKIKETEDSEQISKKVAGYKIKENLERLTQETKEKLEKLRHQRNLNKSSVEAKSSKNLSGKNSNYKYARTSSESMPNGFDSVLNKNSISGNESEGENYSFLYNEYKKIMSKKTSYPRSTHGSIHAVEGLNFNSTIQGNIHSLVQSQKNLQKVDSKKIMPDKNYEWKESMKSKYDTLIDKYEKNVLNTRTNTEARRQERLHHNSFEEQDSEQTKNNKPEKLVPAKDRVKGGLLNIPGPEHFEVEGHHPKEPSFNMSKTIERIADNKVESSDRDEVKNLEGVLIHEEASEFDREQELNGTYLDNYEIAEAAAIFIQKNYRGYHTRKILRDYFQQLCKQSEEDKRSNELNNRRRKEPSNDSDKIKQSQKHLKEKHNSSQAHQNSKQKMLQEATNTSKEDNRMLTTQSTQNGNKRVPALNIGKRRNFKEDNSAHKETEEKANKSSSVSYSQNFVSSAEKHVENDFLHKAAEFNAKDDKKFGTGSNFVGQRDKSIHNHKEQFEKYDSSEEDWEVRRPDYEGVDTNFKNQETDPDEYSVTQDDHLQNAPQSDENIILMYQQQFYGSGEKLSKKSTSSEEKMLKPVNNSKPTEMSDHTYDTRSQIKSQKDSIKEQSKSALKNHYENLTLNHKSNHKKPDPEPQELSEKESKSLKQNYIVREDDNPMRGSGSNVKGTDVNSPKYPEKQQKAAQSKEPFFSHEKLTAIPTTNSVDLDDFNLINMQDNDTPSMHHTSKDFLSKPSYKETIKVKENNTSLDKIPKIDQTASNLQHQKRPLGIQSMQQKSDSDLMRDNIIAELKIIEQQAEKEKEKEIDVDALEKELDRANKQQKTNDQDADEYLLKSEESGVGRPSWSDRREFKEGDSPKSDNKMKSGGVQNSQDDSKLSNSRQEVKDKEKVGASPSNQKSHHFKEEFLKLKEDQMNQWSDLICQLKLLKTSEATLSNSALTIIETMQQKLENQKKRLEERRIESGTSELLPNIQLFSSNGKEAPILDNEKLSSKQIQENHQEQQGLKQDLLQKNTIESEPVTKLIPLENKKMKSPFRAQIGLQIDTEAINAEFSNPEQKSGRLTTPNKQLNSPTSNLDLSKLRIAMGSEQFVRENLNTSNNHECIDGDDQLEELQSDKTARSSLFNRDPFKEFAQKKFKEMLKQENVAHLISLREKVLDNRHKTQVDTLKKMLETNRVSPKSFQAKTLELEKWVTRERDQINKSKLAIQKGWTVFQETVKRTKRDILFMKKAKTGDVRMSFNDISLQQTSNRDEENGLRSGSRGRQLTDPSDAEGSEVTPKGSSLSFRVLVSNEAPGSGRGSKVIKIIDQFEMKDDNHKLQLEKITSNEVQQDLAADSMSLPDLKPIKSRESTDSQNHSRDSIEDRIKYKSEERAKHKDGTQDLKTKKQNPRENGVEDASPLLKQDLESNIPVTSLPKPELKDKTTEKQTKESSETYLAKELLNAKTHNEKKTRQDTQKEEKDKKQDQIVPNDINSHQPAVFVQNSDKDPEKSPSQLPEQNNEAPKIKMKLIEMGNSLISDPEGEDFEEYLKYSSLPEELVQSFKGQIPTEISLSSNLLTPTLSPLISKEYFPNQNRDSEGEKQNLQAIFEQNEEASPISVHPQEQKRETMKDKIDELFKDFSPREKEKLIMIPDPISDRLINSDTFDQEESKSELTLSQKIENENKQIISPRMMQAVEQRGLEKANFKSAEEPAKSKSNLMKFIESTDNAENEPGMLSENHTSKDETLQSSSMKLFTDGINTPTGLSPHEKLAALHGYDIALLQGEHEFTILDAQAVLGVKIYLSGEEKIREMVPERPDFISDVEIIHNKAIFDAFNEALDYLRPYSTQGMPYPWKMNPRTLSREIREDQIQQIFETTKQRVLQWSQYKVGFLGRGIEMVSENSDKRAEVLSILREEKLSKALTNDIQEKEEEWINYDDQRMELQIELSDLIFEKLTMEAAEVLYNIQQKTRAERETQLPSN